MATRHILQDSLLHGRVTAHHLISLFKSPPPPYYLIFTTGFPSPPHNILNLAKLTS